MAGWTKNKSGVPSEIEIIANDISKFFYYNYDEFLLGIDECEKIATRIINHRENPEDNIKPKYPDKCYN